MDPTPSLIFKSYLSPIKNSKPQSFNPYLSNFTRVADGAFEFLVIQTSAEWASSGWHTRTNLAESAWAQYTSDVSRVFREIGHGDTVRKSMLAVSK